MSFKLRYCSVDFFVGFGVARVSKVKILLRCFFLAGFGLSSLSLTG